MVEVKNKQIVITIDTNEPEEDIINLRNEILECVSAHLCDEEILQCFRLVDLLKALSPTLEQEKKAHK